MIFWLGFGRCSSKSSLVQLTLIDGCVLIVLRCGISDGLAERINFIGTNQNSLNRSSTCKGLFRMDFSQSQANEGGYDFSQHASFDGLVFDCDGTLADTMPLHFVAWNKTLTRYGIVFDEDRFYAMAGQPTTQIIRKLLAEQGIEADVATIAKEKEDAFLVELPNVKPIEPVVAIARQFRDSKPMGVGSGSNRNVVFQVLEHIGLADFFDAVVGAEDTKKHKPEPDVFLEVARQIQVAPAGCQVFEDADLGVEAAQRAGMACFDVRAIHTPRRVTHG